MSESTDWHERTELLWGKERVAVLHRAHVLVVGLGGVGAYAAEQLCRAGIGEMTIADGDIVQPSNRNRQLLALRSTEGRLKTDVMAERMRDINPDIRLRIVHEFIRDERLEGLLESPYDYVVDAIDTLSPKVFLIYQAKRAGLRIVSSFGAGAKCNPGLIRIGDIEQSHHCRLGRILRKRLHRLGIRSGVTVVYSVEEVDEAAMYSVDEMNKKTVVGTISYMPALFGCMCASVVLRDIALQSDTEK